MDEAVDGDDDGVFDERVFMKKLEENGVDKLKIQINFQFLMIVRVLIRYYLGKKKACFLEYQILTVVFPPFFGPIKSAELLSLSVAVRQNKSRM